MHGKLVYIGSFILWFLFIPCYMQGQLPSSLGIKMPAAIIAVESELSSGNANKGLDQCEQLLKQKMSNRELGLLWYLKGEAHFMLDQLESAKKAIAEAIHIFQKPAFKTELALAQNKKGVICFTLGEIEAAEVLFSEAGTEVSSNRVLPLYFEIYQNLALLQSSKQNHEQSMESLHKALAIGRQLKEPQKLEVILTQLSTNFYSIGALDSASHYFHQLIDHKKNSTEEVNLTNDFYTLGKIYSEKGNYVAAQTYLLEALKLGEQHADTFLVMSLYSDVATIFAAQKIWDPVFSYSGRAIQLAKQKKVSFVLAQNLKIQGDAFQQLNKVDSALLRYNQSLELFKTLKNTINVADIQLEISNLFQSKENFKSARQYALEALNIRQGISDQWGILQALLVLGELELKTGNLQESLQALNQCLAISRKMNHLNAQKKTVELLSIANAQLGNYASAYSWHQQYKTLNDSISSLERSKEIVELELLYDTEKKNKQLVAQNAALEVQEIKIKRRNSLVLLLGVILGLFGLSALFLYFLVQKNKQLHKQRLEVLQKHQETQRLQAIVEGEEKERKRIAQDLHDGLGAVLATVKIQINALEHEIPKIKEQKSYQKAEDLIDNACDTVREISHNMVPGVLEQYGLETAIEDMCNAMAKTNNLQIDFIPFGLEKELNDLLNVTIYRIVQELLRNVNKHAEASEVIVQLTVEDDQLNLIVEDDGKGFHPDAPDFQPGIGLESIFSRVQYLDGKITIDTIPGKGSTFTIDIPNV